MVSLCKESPFLQLQGLLLLLLAGLRSRLLLELVVLGLLLTPVTLVLGRVDFSISSVDLDTDGNIDGDIEPGTKYMTLIHTHYGEWT